MPPGLLVKETLVRRAFHTVSNRTRPSFLLAEAAQSERKRMRWSLMIFYARATRIFSPAHPRCAKTHRLPRRKPSLNARSRRPISPHPSARGVLLLELPSLMPDVSRLIGLQ